MRADRVGDVGRRKVRVVLLRHPRVGVAKLFATPIGTPFMASAEPCVWRSTWNEISGLIFARRQASRIDLMRPRGSQGEPSWSRRVRRCRYRVRVRIGFS
jgi:hypothetical protein